MTAPAVHAQEVVDFVAACLGAIQRPAYHTDAGLWVWDDEPELAEESAAEADHILTMLEDESVEPRNKHESRMTLAVRGRIPVPLGQELDPAATEQTPLRPRRLARQWIADVRRALGAVSGMDYPPGMETVTFAGCEIATREARDNFLVATVTYQIDYADRLSL